MSISSSDFAKLQAQAKLTLGIEEQKTILSQLNEALEAIRVFDELKTENVKPLAQPIEGTHNVWREDKVEASLPQEEVLSQAKSHDGYIMVPAVLDQSDN